MKGVERVMELCDVQNSGDTRNIAINKVGVRNVTYPIVVEHKKNTFQNTVAQIGLYVDLPATDKGTHMSRFIEILSNFRKQINIQEIPNILKAVQTRLEAASAFIDVEFPYFVEKLAPVSRLSSLMHYHCSISGSLTGDTGDYVIGVNVPITTVCPCSKEISEYGAHNQRGEIRLRVRTNGFVWFEDLIDVAENSASCDVHALLKRPDEKYVTERAYENPKFVEDVVRDTIVNLRQIPEVVWVSVEVENFESIHDHSAYAKIFGDFTDGSEIRGDLASCFDSEKTNPGDPDEK
jgi:GTP cyclohydrolase IB